MSSLERYRYSVLQVCQDLNAAIKGSGDPISDQEFDEKKAWLIQRLEQWEAPKHAPTEYYDYAVRLLVLATLQVSSELPENSGARTNG